MKPMNLRTIIKNANLLLSAILYITVFTSCENTEMNHLEDSNSEINEPINTLLLRSESVNDYAYIFTSSFRDIYNNTIDGEQINEIQALKIFDLYSKQRSSIDLFQNYPDYTLTRSTESDQFDFSTTLKETFTENQLIIINELLQIDFMEENILFDLRSQALLLSENESQTIVNIIDIIQHSINEIEYYVSIKDSSYSTRNTKQTFVCNLGAGMIGGVAGFLAGALTGSVTGPGGLIVGSVVSTTVSAYISTKAC